MMLCLSQIGELLGKIESLGIVDQLPVRLETGLRNVIIHNYDGIDRVQLYTQALCLDYNWVNQCWIY